MSNKKLPKQIRNILTEDETIDRSFDLRGCKVYATSKRLLELRGRTVIDYDYAHISSIEYTSKRYWRWIILGIVVMAAGIFAGLNIDDGAYIILGLILVGLILLIIGVVVKPEWVTVRVVGLTAPVTYKGSKDELDSLLQIVRTKGLTESAVSQKETRDIDFVETIRRLAQLRDDGILTQEEFEDKKSKILRDSD